MVATPRVPPLQLPVAADRDIAVTLSGISKSILGWSTVVARLLNNPILAGLSVFTVAKLPTAGPTASFAYASNGRKVGEGVGAGTGVPCYKSADGTWRRLSDDTVVVA